LKKIIEITELAHPKNYNQFYLDSSPVVIW